MKKIVVDNVVKQISDEILTRSINEAEYFPIDKKFLGKYSSDIIGLDPVAFTFYNFEKINPTYTNTLFLCLPEVWRRLDLEDLILMMKNFTNAMSYYSLLQFSYKYLEINILPLIINQAKDLGYYKEIRDYLLNQWNVLIKSDEEKLELEIGYEKEFLDYDVEEWMYIKAKFLLDKRISPANQDKEYLKPYVKSLF